MNSSITLVGNLTRQPELRRTNSGASVANLGLAVNRRWRDAGGEPQESTSFFTVVAWGTLAVAPVASYAITGLSPGSTHTYAVEAYDSAGNTSDMSDPITVTTPVPPAAPQNVVATPATGSAGSASPGDAYLWSA